MPHIPASVSPPVTHPHKANPCWSWHSLPAVSGPFRRWILGAKVSRGRKGRRRMRSPRAMRGREETRRGLFCGGPGNRDYKKIKKRPAKIRKAGEHSALLWSCHTSLYFIAFVQHPIVPLPFVPYSQPWLFITQPALLFSFLLFEVPERKVLFSAV